MDVLSDISYLLPESDNSFNSAFLSYIEILGTRGANSLTLTPSIKECYPLTHFEFREIETPTVLFTFKDGSKFEIKITNITNQTKQSPYRYTPILISEFVKRIHPLQLQYIDHTGFNLPYFDGIHPQLLKLRNILKDTCLYHTFPKDIADEPWDFIIPGTGDEIGNNTLVDYSLDRKPKIEIVSFNTTSTPLIQIDMHFQTEYKNLSSLFPEAINVVDSQSLWVYIKNPFDIDICFVLNESHNKDWGYKFADSRII